MSIPKIQCVKYVYFIEGLVSLNMLVPQVLYMLIKFKVRQSLL